MSKSSNSKFLKVEIKKPIVWPMSDLEWIRFERFIYKLILERFNVHTKIDITLSDLTIFRTKSFVMEIQREAHELCVSYRRAYRAHFYCHMVPKIELALFYPRVKTPKTRFPQKSANFPRRC